MDWLLKNRIKIENYFCEDIIQDIHFKTEIGGVIFSMICGQYFETDKIDSSRHRVFFHSHFPYNYKTTHWSIIKVDEPFYIIKIVNNEFSQKDWTLGITNYYNRESCIVSKDIKSLFMLKRSDKGSHFVIEIKEMQKYISADKDRSNGNNYLLSRIALHQGDIHNILKYYQFVQILSLNHN